VLDSLAQEETLDPCAISPLDRARSKRRKPKSKQSTFLENVPQVLYRHQLVLILFVQNYSILQEIEFAGIKFPVNLDTPHAVAQVLNQEPGKLRIKDLREGIFFGLK
jgi:hypothetical protein